MLAFLLAILVGIAGLALLSTAFFFPGLYRKNDIIWGGVALFYALVLWICAQRITGAVLLGQTASVALTGWLGWQALMWRWSKLPNDERSTIADGSSVKQGLEKLKRTDWKSKLQSSSTAISESVGKGTKAVEKSPSKTSPSKTNDVAQETATEAAKPVTAVAEPTNEAVDDSRKKAPAVAQTITAKVEQVDSTAKPTVSATPTQSASQKPEVTTPATQGLGAITGLIGGLRDRLQGRKNHGKKYIRPTDEADSKPPKTTSDEPPSETETVAPSEDLAAAVVDVAEAETTAQVEAETEAKAGEEATAEAQTIEAAQAKAEAAKAEAKAQEEAAAQAKAEAEAKEAAAAKVKAEEAAEAEAQAKAGAEAQAETETEAQEESASPEMDMPEEAVAQVSSNKPPEVDEEETVVENSDPTLNAGDTEAEDQGDDSATSEASADEDPNWPPRDETWNDEPEDWEKDN